MGTTDSSVALGGEFVEDYLEHYGVKGMRWGVHRKVGEVVKRKVHPQVDPDAPDVAVVKTAKAKIKANKTTDVLNNKELQAVVTRMNLEQQYSRLSKPDPNSREAKLKKKGIEWATNAAISSVEAPIKARAKAKYGDFGAAAVEGAFDAMRPGNGGGKKKKNKGNGNGNNGGDDE